MGAVIRYAFKAKPKGGDPRILDADGRIVRALSSTKEEPEEAEDDPDADDEAKPAVLSLDPGVCSVVWDLRYEGARWIRKAVDSGNPAGAPCPARALRQS